MKNVATKLNVVFVDDNDEFLDTWRKSFKRAAPPDGLTLRTNDRAETRKAVVALDKARLKARESRKVQVVADAELFNTADLVFVDYDLIELEETTALTGEDIAYLLRCFTTCGVIVLLNPPDLGEQFFDLRLRRSMDFWADLVLGTNQLNNKWLWSDDPDGFAPWSWPRLPDAVTRRRAQEKALQAALDSPTLDVVDIPDQARVALDHIMTEAVATRKSGANVDSSSRSSKPYTIREFVLDSGYGVHRRDRRALENANSQLVRIAAARLSSWLEHVVLPAQSVLVDAPHLASRLPGLLVGDPSKQASWRGLEARDGESINKVIRHQEIKASRFAADVWLSRPAWFWPLITENKRYVEWAQATKVADVVFCEDISRFVARSKAHEFIADVPSQFAIRYVAKPKVAGAPKSSDYRPAVRLSM